MGCAPRNEGRILWATVAGPRQNHLLWALGWERFKIGITSWSFYTSVPSATRYHHGSLGKSWHLPKTQSLLLHSGNDKSSWG